MPCGGSHPLDETIHHPLLAGLVEGDGELVAVDGGDVAVAEFLVEYAVADGEVGDGARRFGDQLAFDGEWQARACAAAAEGDALPALVIRRIRIGVLVEAAAEPAAPARLRALPAGRAVARAEVGHLVETRGIGRAAALRLRQLDMRLRQFVEGA